MKLETNNDPHVKLTISLPSSVVKALEDEQGRIAKQIGFAPPMSPLIASCLKRQLFETK